MASSRLDVSRFGASLTMPHSECETEARIPPAEANEGAGRKHPRRRFVTTAALLVAMVTLVVVTVTWLGSKANTVKNELEATSQLIPVLKENIAGDNPAEATATVGKIRTHAAAAREAIGDPLWTLASALPGLGANFSAVTEVARAADDVATLGASPLVEVFTSLNWDSLIPGSAGTNLEPMRSASPRVASAAHAVRVSAERLERIDETSLLPQVAEPLTKAREQLQGLTGTLDASADASHVLPGMLGADGERKFLLLIQNNAEARASGGIPGALAVLTLNEGKLALGGQSSASTIGVMSPTLPVDAEQRQIYSGRLGKFMQDVNLTPDFPTTATTAQAMWKKKTGQRVDGVIAIDPVVLGYILDATGPVRLANPDLVALADSGLPTELTGKNVVPTLLSDVYAKIEQPHLQDVYFAGVAQEVFSALSGGQGNAKGLIEGIIRGTTERRVLIWSGKADEQSVLSKYPLSGSVAGPGISPAQFGVYFNDGTGAKMDYYVKRTVQLVEECSGDGYGQVKVRVTSTNTAPADAASSLPRYVTGGGVFGVPAGTVRTNVIAYGPVQANVETVFIAGKKTGFASHKHSGRPVGAVTMQLAPGQSSTVEFNFDKIVQHTEPKLSVTPTVQRLKDVVLDTIFEKCAPVP